MFGLNRVTSRPPRAEIALGDQRETLNSFEEETDGIREVNSLESKEKSAGERGRERVGEGRTRGKWWLQLGVNRNLRILVSDPNPLCAVLPELEERFVSFCD